MNELSRYHYLQLQANMIEMKELPDKAAELRGQGDIHLQNSKRENIANMRRSIIGSRDLGQGTILHGADLTWLRPGVGLAPGHEAQLVGRKLTRPVPAGEYVLLEDVWEL